MVLHLKGVRNNPHLLVVMYVITRSEPIKAKLVPYFTSRWRCLWAHRKAQIDCVSIQATLSWDDSPSCKDRFSRTSRIVKEQSRNPMDQLFSLKQEGNEMVWDYIHWAKKPLTIGERIHVLYDPHLTKLLITTIIARCIVMAFSPRAWESDDKPLLPLIPYVRVSLVIRCSLMQLSSMP